MEYGQSAWQARYIPRQCTISSRVMISIFLNITHFLPYFHLEILFLLILKGIDFLHSCSQVVFVGQGLSPYFLQSSSWQQKFKLYIHPIFSFKKVFLALYIYWGLLNSSAMWLYDCNFKHFQNDFHFQLCVCSYQSAGWQGVRDDWWPSLPLIEPSETSSPRFFSCVLHTQIKCIFPPSL